MKSSIIIPALLFAFLSSMPDCRAEAIAHIAAGGFHSVAVTDDGLVWGWGSASYGILGDQEREATVLVWPYRYCTTPVQITGKEAEALIGIVQIEAGRHFTILRKKDGTVWAWGSNDFGQLGDASEPGPEHFYLSARERSTPGPVRGPGGEGFLTGIASIAAGYQHAAAVRKDGTIWAWGDNGAGQLGDGSVKAVSAPVQVLGPGGKGFLTDVIDIAAGARHTLALCEDGTVWAWGSNSAGQLGDGTLRDSLTPVQVKGTGGQGVLAGVRAVAANVAYSAALMADGTVRAWGNNAFGQIGDGSRKDSAVPVLVKGVGGDGALEGITAIAAGRYYAAALDKNGNVLAWGFNEGGLLGNGELEGSLTPAPVSEPEGADNLTGVTSIAAGSRHMLALKADGTLWAWGSNGAGQLGDGGANSGLTPFQVPEFPVSSDAAHGARASLVTGDET